MTQTTSSVTVSPSLGDIAIQCYHTNFGMSMKDWFGFIWRNRADVFVVPPLRGILIATLVSPDTAHVKGFYGNAKIAVMMIRLFRASHPELKYMTYKCVGRDSKRQRTSTMRKVTLSRFEQLMNRICHG